MNWKGSEMRLSSPNLMCYSDICLERLRKATDSFSGDNQCSGQGWTENLGNTSQMRCRLGQPTRAHLSRGDTVIIISWLRHNATSRKVAGSIPDEDQWIFFNRPNPSSRTMALVLTQSLTEMRTRNLLVGRGGGGKGRSACKAGNHTAICERIV
jgi:hypothetical protein